MAESADYYCGIDLSETMIAELKRKLNKRSCNNIKCMAVDILSKNFKEKDFDVVHVESVIHHFKHIDVILEKLQEIVKPCGKIITCDPLNTALTSKFVRLIYQRYRIDKDWEWPFNHEALKKIEEYFHVEKVRGFMGYAKWAILFAIIHNDLGVYLAKVLHGYDMKMANKFGRELWRCLQLVMCLKKV